MADEIIKLPQQNPQADAKRSTVDIMAEHIVMKMLAPAREAGDEEGVQMALASIGALGFEVRMQKQRSYTLLPKQNIVSPQ